VIGVVELITKKMNRKASATEHEARQAGDEVALTAFCIPLSNYRIITLANYLKLYIWKRI
jgi:hypothetical protein